MSLAPEGTYKAKCNAIGVETTSTGKEYVSADFKIKDEYGEETYLVEWRGWLTEKAMERTIESLRLMGWHGDDLFELARDGAKSNEVSLDVRHEEYKGKTTARVAFINKPDENPEATEKRRRSLAEKFKKVAAKTKPKDVPEPSIDEDELPF